MKTCFMSNIVIFLTGLLLRKHCLIFILKTNCGNRITYFLLINVDGLPLFRNSLDYKLYPILVSMSYFGFSMRLLCAGRPIYCSMKSKNRKMSPPSILLPKFLNDLDYLVANPIIVKPRAYCMGSKSIYVCDAPARTSLKLMTSHNG